MLRNPSQTNQFGNQLGFLRLKERARRLAHPPAEELVRQSTSNLFNKGLVYNKNSLDKLLPWSNLLSKFQLPILMTILPHCVERI